MPGDRPHRGSRRVSLFAAAAATAVVLIVAIAGGQYISQRRDQSGVGASPMPSESASATATPSPSASASPTASTAARATSDPTVAKYIVALANGWRPSVTSIVVVERDPRGTANEQIVLAVPADGSAATKLARLTDAGTLNVSRDGRRIVAIALTGQASARLAVLDVVDGSIRWLTPDEPGTIASNPVFSYDGMTVFYGRSNASGDLGLFQVGASGGVPKQIRAPARAPLISIPRDATRDGLLVWGGGYEGASVEVLNLNGGQEYSARLTGIVAVRDGAGPRFLLAQGGGTFCCGNAVVWDHLTDARRPIFVDSAQVLGLAWAPDGVRVVAAARDSSTLTNALRLELTDREGAAPQVVAGGDNASWPLWLNAGIAYLYATGSTGETPPTELRIIAPTGGTPRTLYRATSGNALFQYGYVAP